MKKQYQTLEKTFKIKENISDSAVSLKTQSFLHMQFSPRNFSHVLIYLKGQSNEIFDP